jgi:hypothetical protein
MVKLKAMNTGKHAITCILFVLSVYNSNAQEKKYALNGYISSLHNARFDSINKAWQTDNLLHNRFNFKWYPISEINGVIELRNRLRYGETVCLDPKGAAKQYSTDNGFINLSHNIARGPFFVLNSSIDRAYFSYEKEKLKITLGRQRINWGQTWVWNPNDIFNAYSFFDFDYTERPGSDALRLQYYNTEVSATELAVKVNREKKITAAAYYKFNVNAFDMQVLSGVLNSWDCLAGAGFSGAIKSIALRGEATYLRSRKNFADTCGVLLASLSADYTFENRLTLMGEFFYTNNTPKNFSSFAGYYSAPLTVKNLSFVKYNFFVQASYPITHLLNTSLATIFFPDFSGYYLGPSVSYSLSDNIDFSCFLQSFSANIPISNGILSRQTFNLLFLRIKANF